MAGIGPSLPTAAAATAVPMACVCNILGTYCPLTVRVTHKHHAPVKLSHSEKFVP